MGAMGRRRAWIATLALAGATAICASPASAAAPLTARVSPVSAVVGAGEAVRLTVTLSNPNTAPVQIPSGDGVVDAMPAGWTYVPGSTSGLQSTDAVPYGDQLALLAGGYVIPAARRDYRRTVPGTATLSFSLRAPSRPGTYENSIAVEFPGQSWPTLKTSLVVPALSARLSPVSAVVGAGAAVRLTVTFLNPSTIPAQIPSSDGVVDSLPPGWTYVAGSTTGLQTSDAASVGDQLVLLAAGYVIPGAGPRAGRPVSGVATLSFSLRAPNRPGTYENSIAIEYPGQAWPNLTTRLTVPPLRASVSPVSATVGTGQAVRLTVRFFNPSSVPAQVPSGDGLVDSMPAGWTYVHGSMTGPQTSDAVAYGDRLAVAAGGYVIPAARRDRRGTVPGTATLSFSLRAPNKTGTYANSIVVEFPAQPWPTLTTKLTVTRHRKAKGSPKHTGPVAPTRIPTRPVTPTVPPPSTPTPAGPPAPVTAPPTPNPAATATTLTLAVPTAPVAAGTQVPVTATLSPAEAGAAVAISYAGPDGTHVVHTVTTASTGVASDSILAAHAGTWAVTAHYAGSATRQPSDAQPVTFAVVAVRPAALALTCAVASAGSPFVAGIAASYTGTLTPAVAGSPVVITYSRAGGGSVVHTATTDATGYFADTIAWPSAGAWTVTAAFAGDATRGPASGTSCAANVLSP